MSSAVKKSVGAITVVMSVIGGAVLLGTGAGAAVTGTQQLSYTTGPTQLDVSGVTSLGVDVHGAAVTVEFRDDVESAQLHIENGSARGWRLVRDEDELTLEGPGSGFLWFQPNWGQSDQRVTLVLPQRMQGLDADFTVTGGSLTAEGTFGELDLELNAGDLEVTGEAKQLDVELSAGRANVDLRGVLNADYSLTAGNIVSVLRTAPQEVSIDVTAGEVVLTLPDVGYALNQDVTAGSLDSALTQVPSSKRLITADVTAGSVRLLPGSGN